MSFHYHHLDKWLCANLDLVEEALETHEKAIVVIGGASSSGKSFCARQLKDYLSHHHHRALILSLDQYDYGLSGIIPNKVQENFFKEPLPHLEEIEAAIKEIIYSVPFDKKYSEPVLQKIAPKIRPYFSSEKDFETFRKALPIEWKRLNFDEPSVYNLKEAAEDVNILYEGGKITEKLSEKDSKNKDVYEKNQKSYSEKLKKLDGEYENSVRNAHNNTLIFADRFPFRYMTDDYKLKYYAAFVGCSAETEASFKTVKFLADKLTELKLPALMTIDGSDQKIAKTVRENL